MAHRPARRASADDAEGESPMSPAAPRLAAALAILSLAACGTVSSTVKRLGAGLHNADTEEGVDEAPSPPEPRPKPAPLAAPDPELRPVLAGRWSMEPKAKDALVPNIVILLHPDGRLNLLRDDSGGTNFTFQLWGTWSASASAPTRYNFTFDYVGVNPKRRCYALPGTCEDFTSGYREAWTFAATGPDTMETPGAVWRRSPLP
jgi:hypothetical protein